MPGGAQPLPGIFVFWLGPAAGPSVKRGFLFQKQSAMIAAAAGTFRPKVLYPYHFGNTETSAPAKLRDTEEIAAGPLPFGYKLASALRTSSTWPSTFTFGKTFLISPSFPIIKVVRSIPRTVFP